MCKHKQNIGFSQGANFVETLIEAGIELGDIKKVSTNISMARRIIATIRQSYESNEKISVSEAERVMGKNILDCRGLSGLEACLLIVACQ